MTKKVGATENFGFKFCGSFRLYSKCFDFTRSYILFVEPINQIPTSIDNGHIDGDTAVQAVSGAAQSWIIGTDCHLHFVQDSLIINAVFDQCRGGLFDR